MKDIVKPCRIKISVITVTNKEDKIANIIRNFMTQHYPNKELILILNNDVIDINYVKIRLDKVKIPYKLLQYPAAKTLGYCLNQSVEKMTGGLWAKFDDDDIYFPNYLTELYNSYLIYGRRVIYGKYGCYIYYKPKKALYLKKSKMNSFVNFIRGPTLFCHRTIFDKIRFDNCNRGEDTLFINKAMEGGIKLYATSCRNFIYVRGDNEDHTWRCNINKILGNNICRIVNHLSQ